MTMLVEEKKSVRFDESRRSGKGGWGLFRGRKSWKKTAAPEVEEEQQEPVSILSDKYGKFEQASPEEDPEFQTRAMVVHPRAKTKKQFRAKKEIILQKPPSAKQAAFGGPVRYDWIDIETTAALKVQAAYRRNKVMNDLERQGLSTGAIRNRARRRNAESSQSFFSCCGTNFSFADFSSHDREAHREYQRLVYQEQKKARFQHDESLRSGFSKMWSSRRSQKNKTDEAFEVVE